MYCIKRAGLGFTPHIDRPTMFTPRDPDDRAPTIRFEMPARMDPAPRILTIIENENRQPIETRLPALNPYAPFRYIRPRMITYQTKTRQATTRPIEINAPIPTTIIGGGPKPIVASAPINRLPEDRPFVQATAPGIYPTNPTETIGLTETTEPATELEPAKAGFKLPDVNWGMIAGVGIISWALWQGKKDRRYA